MPVGSAWPVAASATRGAPAAATSASSVKSKTSQPAAVSRPDALLTSGRPSSGHARSVQRACASSRLGSPKVTRPVASMASGPSGWRMSSRRNSTSLPPKAIAVRTVSPACGRPGPNRRPSASRSRAVPVTSKSPLSGPSGGSRSQAARLSSASATLARQCRLAPRSNSVRPTTAVPGAATCAATSRRSRSPRAVSVPARSGCERTVHASSPRSRNGSRASISAWPLARHRPASTSTRSRSMRELVMVPLAARSR